MWLAAAVKRLLKNSEDLIDKEISKKREADRFEKHLRGLVGLARTNCVYSDKLS